MRRALLAFALWFAGCKEQGPNTVVHNQCFEQAGCGDARQVICDPNLLKCLRSKTNESYQLFVRVTPADSGVLADAGIDLVKEYVENLGELTGQRDAEVLLVPSAVTVLGSVLSPTDAGTLTLLPSQVTLSARDAMVPLAANVIETLPGIPKDGGAPHLQARLDPRLHYDLRVQPLFSSSSRLPPFATHDVGTSGPLDVNYAELSIASRSGRFIYRDELRADSVRLQDRATGRVLSSTAVVETRTTTNVNGEERLEGVFTLYAQPSVFNGNDFDLVVGVAGFNPWQVTITIDGQRLLAGSDMLLPPVPKRVHLSAWVEDSSAKRLPNTDLVFVSSYPQPSDVNQDGGLPPDGGPPTAFGTDWCRWEDPAHINCKGRFETTSDESGNYEVDLIPGSYEVFVLPRAKEPASQNVVVTKQVGNNPKNPTLLVREGSSSGSAFFVGQRITPFKGTVYASNLTSPQVTLHASRRPTPPFSSWGSVADFNRNLSVVSDRKGHFSIAPDVGYYDFVFEPEYDSFFAWKLWLDCPNGPGSGWPLSAVRLSAPVMVFGSVEVEDTGTRLAGAKIEAFTIVESQRNGARSVMIGRTFSNANGDYWLALPPQVGEQDASSCEGRARTVTDNERARR